MYFINVELIFTSIKNLHILKLKLKYCRAHFLLFRYIKALESIRNLRKEQSNDVKSFEKELGYLTDTKNKAAEVTIQN